MAWHPISIAGGLSFFAAITQIAFSKRLPPLQWSITSLGAAFYLLNTFLFIAAIQLSSVANAVLLQLTAPIYVAIFGGIFIAERSNFRDWISLLFILFGISVFFHNQMSPVELTGTTLAAISGMSVAGYTLCLRKQKNQEPINVVILGSIGAFLISLPWLLQENFTLIDVSLIATLGCLCYGISFLLYTTAIKQVRAIEALLISTLEIILGPMWAFLLLYEVPSNVTLFGGSIILCVVFLYSLSVIREESSPLIRDLQ